MDHDDEVFPDAVVFDVHQIIDEFVIGRGVVLGEDLGQAGDTRFDVMAIGVFGVFFFELFDEVRPFWSRANEAHVAVEDIENLRQFVEPGGADEFADFGNARIVFGCQLGTGIFFSIDAHGTEFINLIFLAEAADADLAVEDGTAVAEFDGQGDGNSERQGADSGDASQDDVDSTLDGPLFDAEAQALGPEDRDVVDFLQHGAVAEDFIRTGDDIRLDFLIRAVVDDIRLGCKGDIRTNDERVDVAGFQFLAPIFLRIHDDVLELQLELRLGTHAVIDMTTFVFVAHNHDASDGMKALFPTLDGPFPKAEQDKLYGRTGNNQYPGISEFMNDETQGHDQDEDQEETDSQADQDFAESLVLDGIQAIDAEHHDREDDGNRKHSRVQDMVRFYRCRIDKQIGQDKICKGDDSHVAQ